MENASILKIRQHREKWFFYRVELDKSNKVIGGEWLKPKNYKRYFSGGLSPSDERFLKTDLIFYGMRLLQIFTDALPSFSAFTKLLLKENTT